MITVAPTIEASGIGHAGRDFDLREIVAYVQRMDSEVRPGSATFDAAVLLRASLHIGQNVDRLSRFTGIARELVARSARRLVDNGVWHAGRTVSTWVENSEQKEAFWSDVAVAEGKLCRRAAEDGELEWAPQGHWRKHYEYVAPKGGAPATVCYHPHVEPIQQDIPYILEEEQEDARSVPDALSGPADWLTEEPEEPEEPEESTVAPVWLGQGDGSGAEAEPISVTIGAGAPEMFPDAVWLR